MKVTSPAYNFPQPQHTLINHSAASRQGASFDNVPQEIIKELDDHNVQRMLRIKPDISDELFQTLCQCVMNFGDGTGTSSYDPSHAYWQFANKLIKGISQLDLTTKQKQQIAHEIHMTPTDFKSYLEKGSVYS